LIKNRKKVLMRLFLKVFSSTGFSLCSFDFGLPQIKTTQAEACATEKRLFDVFLPPRKFRSSNPFLQNQ
jgi:hypothetical protein